MGFSGDITDTGMRQGKYYSINLPLKDGIDDRTYERLFKVPRNFCDILSSLLCITCLCVTADNASSNGHVQTWCGGVTMWS